MQFLKRYFNTYFSELHANDRVILIILVNFDRDIWRNKLESYMTIKLNMFL